MKLDQTLVSLLPAGSCVGSIRVRRPTIYIFCGGQEDSAFFSISGFSVLLDGGDQKEVAYWNLIRNYDRVSAVISTRASPNCLRGLATILTRKAIEKCHPSFGAFICNLPPRNFALGESEPCETIRALHDGLQSEELKPIEAFVNPKLDPITLYEIIGEGALRMVVLNPERNSKDLQNIINALKTGENVEKSCAAASLAIILVWHPSDPTKPTTRILFPGACPLEKLYASLEKCKGLEYLRRPVYRSGSREKLVNLSPRSRLSAGVTKTPSHAKPFTNKRSLITPSEKERISSRPAPPASRTVVKEAAKKIPEPPTTRRTGAVSSTTSRLSSRASKPLVDKKPEPPVTSARTDERNKIASKTGVKSLPKSSQAAKTTSAAKDEKSKETKDESHMDLSSTKAVDQPLLTAEPAKEPELSPSDSLKSDDHGTKSLKTSDLSSLESPILADVHDIETVDTAADEAPSHLPETEANVFEEQAQLDNDESVQPTVVEAAESIQEEGTQTIKEDERKEELLDEHPQQTITDETKDLVVDESPSPQSHDNIKLLSDALADTPLLDSTPDEKSPFTVHGLMGVNEECDNFFKKTDDIGDAGDFAADLVSSIVDEAISEQKKAQALSSQELIDHQDAKVSEDSFNANPSSLDSQSKDQCLIGLEKESDINASLLAEQDNYEDLHAKVNHLPPIATVPRARARTTVNGVPSKPKLSQPLYFDMVFVPHHGPQPALPDQTAAKVFATSIRSRRYVLSGQNAIRTYILDGIMDAKNAWNQPDLEVDVLPTHDSDDLTAFHHLKESELAELGIGLRCPVERCTLKFSSGGATDICAAFKIEL